MNYHVFIDYAQRVFSDMLRRGEYSGRFAVALDGWSEIRAAIPQEWFFSPTRK